MADALGTGGSPSPVSAVDHRLALAGLITPQTSSLAVRTGVLVAPGSTALVTGTSATGTMTVSVAAHHWVTTRGSADGIYLGTLEAATTVNISAAPGSNSRIDVVYVRQKDASSTISPDGASALEVGVVTGTAAVSPTKPAFTAAHTGAVELATVTVAAGATSTNGAGVTIANTARLTAARGAPILVRDQAERDALTAYDGLSVKRLDRGGAQEDRVSGAWQPTALGKFARGTTSISVPATTQTVTQAVSFGVTFASAPVVLPAVTESANEYQWVVLAQGITTTGFTARLRWTSTGGAPVTAPVTVNWLAAGT